MTIHVFNRPEVKKGKPFNLDAPARCFSIEVEIESTDNFEALQIILDAAFEQGVNKGSSRSGIFEVQTADGIWSHKSERRIEIETERKRKNVEFKSWEELAWEEERESFKNWLAKNNLLAA